MAGIYPEQERAMEKQFTASEVRERERFEEWYTTHAFNYSRDPIGSRDCSLQWEAWKAARADLLEAQEKAMLVADYDPRASLTVPIDTTTLQRNAIHPAPSEAERLAEALRNLVSEWVAIADDGDATLEDSTLGYRACANRLSATLTAHSAQAQPPAASVTDALRIWANADPSGDAMYDAARMHVKEMLAAQENPNG